MINRILKNDKNDMLNNKDNALILFEEIEKIIVDIINRTIMRISLDTLLEIYGETIDEFIIECVKRENLSYIAGTLTLTKLKEHLEVTVECYFQNSQKAWIKKETKNNIELSKIKQETIKDVQMKFDIESPIK